MSSNVIGMARRVGSNLFWWQELKSMKLASAPESTRAKTERSKPEEWCKVVSRWRSGGKNKFVVVVAAQEMCLTFWLFSARSLEKD